MTTVTFSSIDVVVAGAVDRVYYGTDDIDFLQGSSGNDKLFGMGGHDQLEGGDGDDQLYGNAGDDNLRDTKGKNWLDGGEGDDFLSGGEGDMLGGPGNDRLYANVVGALRAIANGGDGDDYFSTSNTTMPGGYYETTGGAGRDTFNVRKADTGFVFLVTDFVAGEGGDLISLGQLYGLNSANGGDNPFANGSVRLTQQGNDALVQVRANPASPVFHTALTLANVKAHELVTGNFREFIDPAGSSIGQVISGSDARDVLTGGWFDDVIGGGSDNDYLNGSYGNDAIDGGPGLDTAQYSGNRADYTVSQASGKVTIAGSKLNGGTDVLTSVERLDFNDMTLAFDADGTAGQVYRVYQAAFNRTPDKRGLAYWIEKADAGISLRDICGSFAASAEFKALYGAAPSNSDLVERFYQNVLHRAPDGAGKAYWVELLDQQRLGVSDVLGSFSESRENQEALATIIGQGIEFSFH